jgi:hypothetical protein
VKPKRTINWSLYQQELNLGDQQNSDKCNFNGATGIAAFDFTDTNCLDVQYGSSSDDESEPDQIEYIVTFEKQVPQTLVDQYDLTPVQIAYSFSCVGRFYDVVKQLCSNDT